MEWPDQVLHMMMSYSVRHHHALLTGHKSKGIKEYSFSLLLFLKCLLEGDVVCYNVHYSCRNLLCNVYSSNHIATAYREGNTATKSP